MGTYGSGMHGEWPLCRYVLLGWFTHEATGLVNANLGINVTVCG
jgi:hypothetical protein